ncbi:hypothetical protein D9M69_163340 [compost metagenome]
MRTTGRGTGFKSPAAGGPGSPWRTVAAQSAWTRAVVASPFHARISFRITRANCSGEFLSTHSKPCCATLACNAGATITLAISSLSRSTIPAGVWAGTNGEWLRYWGVNVHGTFYCTREALRLMQPQRYGRIVNIASIAGISSRSAHSPHAGAGRGTGTRRHRADQQPGRRGGLAQPDRGRRDQDPNRRPVPGVRPACRAAGYGCRGVAAGAAGTVAGAGG